MMARNSKISVSHLITFDAAAIAVALGRSSSGQGEWRWTSRFCETAGGCSLGPREVDAIIGDADRLIRKYHGARNAGIAAPRTVAGIFSLLADAIERRLDLDDPGCVCSWTRRITNAEELAVFLLNVARAYWSTGESGSWMVKELERLACLATDVFERNGSFARPASNDCTAEARADRLAIRLFDAANDFDCNNWAHED